jgi:peptidoglycan/LPS O-acetylase OafA/YrhL
MLNVSEAAAHRLGVLDGWRGISILLVLCGHLLPLGFKGSINNAAVAATGMVIFFILSGFLITQFLLKGQPVRSFLIRRGFRILPLAWLYMLLAIMLYPIPRADFLPLFAFYANLPPFYLEDVTGHLWSLCVEVQFYLSVALIVAVFGRAALRILPLLCVFVTGIRIYTGTHISIVTWVRIDEILAGATLALVYTNHPGLLKYISMSGWLTGILFLFTILSAYEFSGFLGYLRPYLAALCIGSTLTNSRGRLHSILTSRMLAYLAEISFALYVFHPMLSHSWLGSGSRLVKYLKRPLLCGVLVAIAHCSTRYFERRLNGWGHRLTRTEAIAPHGPPSVGTAS